MVTGDAQAVVAIGRQCPEAAGWPEESYARLEELGYRGWVAVAGEEICGFLVARCAAGEAEILNLAVKPERRRQGHARGMLRAAMEGLKAEGVREVYLEVRESNAGAQAFYEGAGFERSGRRLSYYEQPKEDAVCMVHRLVP
ncbi:MAG: ribosomal protein S18-alanine N-acetyltransferase [Acidobacteriia bacterium]|nr:ribosomal protein S18-alanine N-acetyltransferase [Terriglobia bacterium]